MPTQNTLCKRCEKPISTWYATRPYQYCDDCGARVTREKRAAYHAKWIAVKKNKNAVKKYLKKYYQTITKGEA